MATIMVMDDEAPIRTLIRTALESVGHEVMEAANGHDGLALYRQRPADLVIADILMPELDGLDTIIELMQEFLDVKVIAISGAPEDQRMLNTARRCAIRIGTLVHLPSARSMTLHRITHREPRPSSSLEESLLSSA